MNDADIIPYARLVLVQALDAQGWPEGFHRRSDLFEAFRAKIWPALDKYDPRVPGDIQSEILNSLFDELVKDNVFFRESDGFAGDYYLVRPDGLKTFRSARLNNNSLMDRARQIGFDRFFSDVFAAYRAMLDGERAPTEELVDQTVGLSDNASAELLPASDRMVPLNHNSEPYRQVKAGLQELETELRGANDLDCTPEERGRLLASLEAAQRLWDATQLKVMQIKIAIIMTAEEVIGALSNVGKAVGKSVIVDTIKSIVKAATGIEL